MLVCAFAYSPCSTCDVICQALGSAFGEREVLEACLRAVQQASPQLQSLLLPLVTLFALNCIERDLSWFMAAEIITPQVGARIWCMVYGSLR
jgi:Acyl-CoA oxidase